MFVAGVAGKVGKQRAQDSTTAEFWHCHHHRGICSHPMSFVGHPCKSFADTRIKRGRKKEIRVSASLIKSGQGQTSARAVRKKSTG